MVFFVLSFFPGDVLDNNIIIIMTLFHDDNILSHHALI